MSDEQLPLRAELASAYLDGELDANERAAAAADPEVMAVVDSLTRVRAVLGEVDPVVTSTKTAAIAAALSEFDVLHAASTPKAVPATATARVISLLSRRDRAYRVLTRVAAALVIGVVGVAALKAAGGSESKDSASSATELSPAAATEVPQLKIAAETAGAAETTAAAAGAAVPGADTAADAGGFADLPSIDTDDALRQFAASIEAASSTPQVAAPAATTAAAATAAPSGSLGVPSCANSDQTVLGPIVFRGTPAFAVRNTTTGNVLAVADNDCRVLTEVAP